MVGDLHGQFYDFLELLRVVDGWSNPESEGRFLFLGDYVDRGLFSLETLTLLLIAKLKAPDRVFMLRGNHETRNQNMARPSLLHLHSWPNPSHL